jgi:pimeloyl-ACP methyl ester carboxylesterase
VSLFHDSARSAARWRSTGADTAVIEASGAEKIAPVTISHAGWIAIELRRRLGERIPKIAFLDWIIVEAPPPFLEALKGMQSPERWRQTVDHILSLWLHGVENPALEHFVREEMGACGFEVWSRAAREISAAYAQYGSPLRALAALNPPIPVLHLYAQPEDAGYLAAQQSFAAQHPWFQVEKLRARSHFPMFETPDEIASAIERFVGRS